MTKSNPKTQHPVSSRASNVSSLYYVCFCFSNIKTMKWFVCTLNIIIIICWTGSSHSRSLKFTVIFRYKKQQQLQNRFSKTYCFKSEMWLSKTITFNYNAIKEKTIIHTYILKLSFFLPLLLQSILLCT